MTIRFFTLSAHYRGTVDFSNEALQAAEKGYKRLMDSVSDLARVQAEGGILQGIGMTLTENVTYDQRGWPMENSLMQYKIPTRVDVGKIPGRVRE